MSNERHIIQFKEWTRTEETRKVYEFISEARKYGLANEEIIAKYATLEIGAHLWHQYRKDILHELI